MRQKQRGIKIYHLNIGQPDIETPKVFMEAVKKADVEVLAYADSNGWEPLRESISKYYKRINLPYEVEDIIITNGVARRCNGRFLLTCDPGEEILVPEPFYTNYRGFAAPYDVVIKPITTKPDDGFVLPGREVLESLITDKTRAIALSNPGNPTASFIPKSKFVCCRTSRAIIICLLSQTRYTVNSVTTAKRRRVSAQ